MSDLLAYEMPITKIIKDNSLKDIERYQIPVFRVKAEQFTVERNPHMRRASSKKCGTSGSFQVNPSDINW